MILCSFANTFSMAIVNIPEFRAESNFRVFKQCGRTGPHKLVALDSEKHLHAQSGIVKQWKMEEKGSKDKNFVLPKFEYS